MIYFIADTHHHHKNVIRFDNRPFSNIYEMDNAIIANWNSIVKPNDTVYHLGDVAMSGKQQAKAIVDKLVGKIILISGNHDKKCASKLSRFETIKDMDVIYYKEFSIHLCHYPIESWFRKNHNQYHLHGHSHGKAQILKNRLDMFCGNWNYTPVSIETIFEKFQNQ